MNFKQQHIIEDLYSTGLFANMETTPEYKELLIKYNKFYDTIEDKELKKQFEKLEEMKNKLYSINDRNIFKVGFSIATKLLMEALSCES